MRIKFVFEKKRGRKKQSADCMCLYGVDIRNRKKVNGRKSKKVTVLLRMNMSRKKKKVVCASEIGNRITLGR